MVVARRLDSLLAHGNTSDVYRWGRDAVVKVLRPGIPVGWADREAETTRLVHAAGLPAPAVLDVTTVDGRPAIVLELIDGVSMWTHMLSHPHDVRRLSRLLAELQAEVNATPAPSGLSTVHDRLRRDIDNARLLSSLERAAVRADLERCSGGTALCHFDIHPNNVLLGPVDPIVIDWFDAAAGSPDADVARSSVLMRQNAVHGYLACADPSIIAAVHDEYLASVLRIRDADHESLLGWESPVLAGRLAEPMGDVIDRDTIATLRTLLASGSTTLAAGLRSARSRYPAPRMHRAPAG